MTSKSSNSNNVVVTSPSGPTLEEQRRRFKSTQLKLQMLSRKTEDIQIDDYIKKLTLDNTFISRKTDSKSVAPKVKESSFPTCDARISTKNQPHHWGPVSNHSSDVFSTESGFENSSHLLDLPEVGYLNPTSSVSSVNSFTKPTWLRNLSSLPAIYGEAIRAATTSHGLDSSVIYEIFRSSNLNTEVLYHIWSLTSCTQPGWFTPTELVTALALIGLAQRRQWEFRSNSVSEAITIQSLYAQIYPPVPVIRIPNTKRQFNSPDGSVSQETAVNGLWNSVASDFSKFPFQPPVVAFSTFLDHSDTNDTLRNQLSQTLVNSTGLQNLDPKTSDHSVHFTSSGPLATHDPEWSDFTSFTSTPVEPSDDNNLKGVGEVVVLNGQATPVTSAYSSLLDEEFGDFQTSHSNGCCYLKQSKTVLNGLDSVDLKCEVNSSESLREQWLFCLTECLKVFNESLSVLSSLDTIKDRIEFAESEEGANFLLDITEIYLMARRINLSARKYSVLNPSMQQEFSDIENLFHELSSFAVTSALKSKTDQALKSLSVSESENIIQDFMNTSALSYCGICLSPINPLDGQCINDRVNESTTSPSIPSPPHRQAIHHLAHINLAGCYYHISCANFWMNRVDLCLPALKLPSISLR
ncbi:unnamed protein product [Heterobilharzia americana]|nr:unnamed protein product [Heterobilharzia americana]